MIFMIWGYFFLMSLYCPQIVFSDITEEMINVSGMLGVYCFEGNQPIESGPIIGIGAGYHLTDHIGIEFTLKYGIFDFYCCEGCNAVENDLNGYLYHLDGVYHLWPTEKLVPYAAAGIGNIKLNDDRLLDNSSSFFNYGGGFHYFLSDQLSFRGDIRHMLLFNESHHNLSLVVGLTYFMGGKSSKNKPNDSDNDGVYDHNDLCPDTPDNAPVDRWGCPLDSDKDGIPDYMDECPNTPLGVKVNSVGCPSTQMNDLDGDGVPDSKDQCPETPIGIEVDKNGCPLDTDKDGVYDYLDQCPGTPIGAEINAVGCWILKNFHFDVDSWYIKPQFNAELDKVIGILESNPTMRIEIQGHTDSSGGRLHNLELSRNRARAVMEYFLSKGIDPGRMTIQGLGYSKPIAPNNSYEGKAMNRRVQIKPIQ